MLINTKPGLYQSDMFVSQKGVIHGFSSRSLGDMRTVQPRHTLKKLLGIEPYRLISAEQVHGNYVHIATPADFGKKVPGADGLVYRAEKGNAPLALGIITADCVPLLFVDLQARVIGAAHAGWKGTRDQIAANIVRSMVALGAKVDRIHAAFGPYIGPCCYDVPEARVKAFEKRFPVGDTVVSRDSKWYLDLGKANVVTLVAAGISPSHIDNQLFCTFDHADTLYSYRKDSKETYGEQMAVISLAAHP